MMQDLATSSVAFLSAHSTDARSLLPVHVQHNYNNVYRFSLLHINLHEAYCACILLVYLCNFQAVGAPIF